MIDDTHCITADVLRLHSAPLLGLVAHIIYIDSMERNGPSAISVSAVGSRYVAAWRSVGTAGPARGHVGRLTMNTRAKKSTSPAA